MTCVGSGVQLVICPAAMKESAYIPYVREHLGHLKVFAGHETAAEAFVKSLKPKAVKKAKAKKADEAPGPES